MALYSAILKPQRTWTKNRRLILWNGSAVWFLLSISLVFAEKLDIKFAEDDLNREPSGFVSLLTGEGEPGDWKVVIEELPSAFAPLTSRGISTSLKPVVKEASGDRTDERFPMLLVEGETFENFTFKTRFKLLAGETEQMAGLAFRVKDENNYYVLRVSALGRTMKFYKFVDGIRSRPVGPDDIPVEAGKWHELAVQCEGNKIRCYLDGEQRIPEITDTSFLDGSLGFWTKSDSVVLFGDAEVDYQPRESLAVTLVRTMMQKYNRLIGLKIIANTSIRKDLHVVASSDPEALGRPASEIEKNVVNLGRVAYGKERKVTTVTMPLRDRNGKPIAAVQVNMETYFGQLEKIALARAMPIVKEMQLRLRGARALTQ